MSAVPARAEGPAPLCRASALFDQPGAPSLLELAGTLSPGATLEIDVTHGDDATAEDAGATLVLGMIVSCRTRLSADGAGIYTEFELEVVDVPEDARSELRAGDVLSAGMLGGRLSLPGERTIWFHGRELPVVGGEYLLRLRRVESGELAILEARAATTAPRIDIHAR